MKSFGARRNIIKKNMVVFYNFIKWRKQMENEVFQNKNKLQKFFIKLFCKHRFTLYKRHKEYVITYCDKCFKSGIYL